MKGWILYHRKQNDLTEEDYCIKRFLEAAREKDIDLEVHSPEYFELIISRNDQKSILMNGVETPLPDFVLPRTGSGTSYFTLAIIRQLEYLNVYVCNSSATIDCVKDKLQIHQLLAQSNLPTPKTMLVKFPIDLQLVKSEIGFPLIVKNITGSEGKGIYLCESPDKLKDLMELMYSYNKNMNIIIQQFVSSTNASDLRVFVIGGKVVGCMKRTAKEGFKANYALGASVEKYEVTPEIEWLATETARLLNLDVTGIDLLFGPNGFKVLEANSAPQFRGMEQITGKVIAEQILDYIMVRLTGHVG